MQAKVN